MKPVQQRRAARFHLAVLAGCHALVLAGCGADGKTGESSREVLVVYTAGSLSRPMRAALDTFARRERVAYQLESAGSLETARKLTELKKIPDIVALADEEVFPKLLIPSHASWYARFARNRLVLAYTKRSRGADRITAENWWQVLQEPGIETGRGNPDLDPAGYRTLMVFQLAERHYGVPGLLDALEAAASKRNMRPKEIELVALLEAGEIDYAWFYESMALAAGLPYVTLPSAIDLSTASDSANYATARVRVHGAAAGDTIELRGAPIRYAFSIPLGAPHPELAARFAVFLASEQGRRALQSAYLPTLPAIEPVGSGVPEPLLTPR
jgi:molybdate/tungstate transport system substrate-binding protein